MTFWTVIVAAKSALTTEVFSGVSPGNRAQRLGTVSSLASSSYIAESYVLSPPLRK